MCVCVCVCVYVYICVCMACCDDVSVYCTVYNGVSVYCTVYNVCTCMRACVHNCGGYGMLLKLCIGVYVHTYMHTYYI